MPDATFACPDLTTFARLDELGLEVTGSAWSRSGRCWRAGSSSRTSGAGAAAARVPLGTA